jgi:hypothetical protein
MFMGPAYATPDQWTDVLSSGSFANLVEGLRTAVDAGVLTLGPAPDVQTMALHVWANIHGLTSLLVARPTMPWPELDAFVDEHLDLCMRSFRSHTPR